MACIQQYSITVSWSYIIITCMNKSKNEWVVSVVIILFWVISQMRFIHCACIKKKNQNSVVLNDTILLLSLDTQRQGDKKFLSPATPLSFSPLAQTLTQPTPLTCHHDEDWTGKPYHAGGWGDCTEAAPAILPCLHDWTEVG